MLDKLSLLFPDFAGSQPENLQKAPNKPRRQEQCADPDPQEKEKLKTLILANFTREILTSMRAIMGLLDGLISLKDDTAKREIEIILKNTRRLLELSSPLVEVFQNMAQQEKEEEECEDIKTDEEFIKELYHAIETNYPDPDFNVEQLANKLCMSKSSLYRKIYELSGESPSEFLRSFRLQRAVQLIKRNFGSVTKVAFEVGFNSRTYFAKCFKEKFHQSPSSYQSGPP